MNKLESDKTLFSALEAILGVKKSFCNDIGLESQEIS
jgi:hypothetical protein